MKMISFLPNMLHLNLEVSTYRALPIIHIAYLHTHLPSYHRLGSVNNVALMGRADCILLIFFKYATCPTHKSNVIHTFTLTNRKQKAEWACNMDGIHLGSRISANRKLNRRLMVVRTFPEETPFLKIQFSQL